MKTAETVDELKDELPRVTPPPEREGDYHYVLHNLNRAHKCYIEPPFLEDPISYQ